GSPVPRTTMTWTSAQSSAAAGAAAATGAATVATAIRPPTSHELVVRRFLMGVPLLGVSPRTGGDRVTSRRNRSAGGRHHESPPPTMRDEVSPADAANPLREVIEHAED